MSKPEKEERYGSVVPKVTPFRKTEEKKGKVLKGVNGAD